MLLSFSWINHVPLCDCWCLFQSWKCFWGAAVGRVGGPGVVWGALHRGQDSPRMPPLKAGCRASALQPWVSESLPGDGPGGAVGGLPAAGGGDRGTGRAEPHCRRRVPAEVCVLPEADEEGVGRLHPVLLRALLHLLPRDLRPRRRRPHGARRLALRCLHHLLQAQVGGSHCECPPALRLFPCPPARPLVF